MSDEPEESEDPEDGGPRITIGNFSSGPLAIGSHASAALEPAGTATGHAAELLVAIQELLEALARTQEDASTPSLGELLAEARSQLTWTGYLSPLLGRRLRSHLAGSRIASVFTPAARLMELLARSEEFAEPEDAEADSFGAVRDSRSPAPPSNPARHTPPGPGTGSDDDEWPDPVNG